MECQPDQTYLSPLSQHFGSLSSEDKYAGVSFKKTDNRPNFFSRGNKRRTVPNYFTAAETIRYLQEFYNDRLITRSLWPARSPDLTPWNF